MEVDEQQVNLTRFSLFFPEKREFFLEAQGIFNFARGVADNNLQVTGLRQIGGGDRRAQGPGNAPTLFYSRRIGLEGGAVVPIVGGGRVTGKMGDFDVGALNIQTDDEQISGALPTNFTVVRIRRDILRRSSVGALFTNRSVSVQGDGSNQAYGADATFSFYDNVNFLGYIARTQTPGREGDDRSYQGQFVYAADRYGLQAEHLVVEENFVPEVGFLRRDNFETRQSQVAFLTEFENSDRLGVSAADNYELLVEPFEAGPGVTLPVGGYGFRDVELLYEPGTQRRFSGELKVRLGEYFNGSIRSVTFSRGRLEVTPQLSVEPTISVNWIDTPHGAFRADLAVSRVTYTFTPRMFFSGLVQYNSSTNTVSNNLRLRWEYIPGSELFVVYTDERFADPFRPDRSYGRRSRGLVVKVNRLFRL